MADAGVKTTELPLHAQVDELLGNKDGSLGRLPVDDLAQSFLGAGPIAAKLAVLSSQITSGSVSQPTWAELAAIVPAQDGTGGEVLETDVGTHTDPVTAGTVNNTGSYAWRAATPGWERIADVSLAGKLNKAANLGDLDDTGVARTNLDVNSKAENAAALALKTPLASPALTGVPTAPTAALATNTTQLATTAFVQALLAAMVDSSPAALDTLNELAAALGDDPNFAATLNAAIAAKAPLASPALTGVPTAPTAALATDSTQLASTAFVQALVAVLLGDAPDNLDTLGKLVDAQAVISERAAVVERSHKDAIVAPLRGGRRRFFGAPDGVDQFGRAHGGFLKSGEKTVVGIHMVGEHPTAGRRRLGWPMSLVRELSGRVVVGLSKLGALQVAGIDFLLELPTSGRRRAMDQPVLLDKVDRPLIAVRGGKLVTDLHADSLTTRLAVGALRGAQGTPEPFGIGKVSTSQGVMVAGTLQELVSGQVFDAAQRTGGKTNLMLMQQAGVGMRVVWFYGQSNSGNYTDADFAAIYTDVRWRQTVTMFMGGPVWNETAFPADFLGDLEQAYDPETQLGIGWHVGQSGCVGVANGVEWLHRNDREYTYGTVALATMKGGERLENLQEGSPVYNNLLLAGAALPSAVALYDRPGISTVDFVLVQGESITLNDINGVPVDVSGTAQDSADAWSVLAAALFDDVTTDIPAQTGCTTLRKYLVQINRAIEGGAESYANTQLQLALDRSDLVMPCSMTMCPLSDTIHPTPLGKLFMDDTIAHVIARLDAGETWEPLRIDAGNITRVGAVITLPIIGGPTDGTLMQDTAWQPAVDGDGFVFDDDGSTASVLSVAYENNPRQVIVTLDGTPTGTNMVIRHAIINTPLIPTVGTTPGWPIGRTRAMVQTARQSPHAAFGVVGAPTFETHYLLRQTVNIT